MAVTCPDFVSVGTICSAVNGSDSDAVMAAASCAGMHIMNYNDDFGSNDNDKDDADALCASFFANVPTKAGDGEKREERVVVIPMLLQDMLRGNSVYTRMN